MNKTIYTNKELNTILKHLPKTIKCGFHSGIPECCIRFYIYRLLYIGKKEALDYQNKIWKNFRLQYIICPECFKKKNFKKIKRCPKGNHCRHANEIPNEENRTWGKIKDLY